MPAPSPSRFLLAAACAGVFSAPILAQTSSVDFDAAGDLTASFTAVRNATNAVHISTAGADGANGYLSLQALTDSGNGFPVRYKFDANGSTAGTNTYGEVSIGAAVRFSADSTGFFTFVLAPASATNDAVGIGWQVNNFGTTDRTVAFTGIGFNASTFQNGASASGNLFDNTVATSGNWYFSQADFTRTGNTASDVRSVRLRVWDSADKTGALLIDRSFSYAEGVAVADGEIGFSKTGNFTVDIDNFTVAAVPEPSAVAAIAGAGALGLAAIRRRRR